jgi:hypothetical protein
VTARHERGLATLAAVMLLVLGAHIGLLWSHRALLAEQRADAAHLRGAQAREAAEAALAWTVAMLGDPMGRGADCEPSGGEAPSLRTRWLDRLAAGAASVRAACVHDADRWRCDCPDDGDARPALPDRRDDHPAFGITLARRSPADTGLLDLTADGCAQPGPDCGAPGGEVADARARIVTVLAPVGRIDAMPEAALTSLGAVTLANGARVQHTDPGGAGVAVHAAGPVAVNAPARTLGPPGLPDAATRRADDLALGAGGPEGLMRRLFGLESSALSRLAGWVSPCAGGGACPAAAVDAALARGARAIWIDADLDAEGATWGRADRPVLLVVRGRWRIGPGAAVHGLVVAGSVVAQVPAGGPRALLRGAVASLGPVRLDGPLDLAHDARTLAGTAALAATQVPVPGAWFDPHER